MGFQVCKVESHILDHGKSTKAVLLSEALGGESILLLFHLLVKVKVLATQSCPVLCDTMDCRPPGSSVHRFLQVRILELVSIPFSRGSS